MADSPVDAEKASFADADNHPKSGNVRPIAETGFGVTQTVSPAKGGTMNYPTECDDLLRVTVRQETAVELILSGQSDTATAATLGIHRFPSVLGGTRQP